MFHPTLNFSFLDLSDCSGGRKKRSWRTNNNNNNNQRQTDRQAELHTQGKRDASTEDLFTVRP